GQNVDGLSRRPVCRTSRSSRSRTELHVRGSLPRCRIRPLASLLHRHRKRDAHHSSRTHGPHGGIAPAWLYRAGKGRNCQAILGQETDAASRAYREEREVHGRCDHVLDPLVHARSRRAQSGTGDRKRLPQKRPCLTCVRALTASASRAISTATLTFTSTCLKGRFRKTDPLPALPLRQPLPAHSAKSRFAAI